MVIQIDPTNANWVKDITIKDRAAYPYFEGLDHLFRRGKGLRRLRIYPGWHEPPNGI